jgi:hypothetical protein
MVRVKVNAAVRELYAHARTPHRPPRPLTRKCRMMGCESCIQDGNKTGICGRCHDTRKREVKLLLAEDAEIGGLSSFRRRVKI